MTQRATVERNAAADQRDRNNQPVAPDWQEHLADLPCFLWSEREREVDGQTNARIERLKLGVPVDADLSPADRIVTVRDRLGNVQNPSTFRILADQRMGWSHRELTLEVIAAAGSAGG